MEFKDLNFSGTISQFIVKETTVITIQEYVFGYILWIDKSLKDLKEYPRLNQKQLMRLINKEL